MNIDNFTFRPSLFLQLENTFQILGILGIFKVAENSYIQAPHIQTLVAFVLSLVQNFWPWGQQLFALLKLFWSWGQPFRSNFAKIPHVGWVRRIKVPTSSCAPLPTSGITLMAALNVLLGCLFYQEEGVVGLCVKGWGVGPTFPPLFSQKSCVLYFFPKFHFLVNKIIHPKKNSFL